MYSTGTPVTLHEMQTPAQIDQYEERFCKGFYPKSYFAEPNKNFPCLYLNIITNFFFLNLVQIVPLKSAKKSCKTIKRLKVWKLESLKVWKVLQHRIGFYVTFSAPQKTK